MGQKIAMLLNGPIFNDYRVIKMIQTLGKENSVDLYYIDGNVLNDKQLFAENIRLFNFSKKKNLKTKILQHSFFCYEFNFFINEVLKSKVKYDIILSNDLPTLYPGYKISKKLNSNLFYDSHEIYTETINQFFPKKNPFFKSLIFNFLIFFMRRHGIKIEKKIFPKLYQFITVNESLLKYFNSKYRIAKGLVVMNVPRDSDAISSVERIDYYSMFDWLKTDIILIYQGGLNEGRGLYLLVESFSKLPKNYKLVILGDGVLRKSLMEKAEQLNLNNSIQFINSVALSELPKYTKGATIGINLLESFNLSKKLASPNKLFEYIHAGIPVIASHSVENKIVLDKFNIGILTENTTEKITQAIQNMTEQAILKYKSNTIEARAHYKWENQEGNILKSMK